MRAAGSVHHRKGGRSTLGVEEGVGGREAGEIADGAGQVVQLRKALGHGVGVLLQVHPHLLQRPRAVVKPLAVG